MYGKKQSIAHSVDYTTIHSLENQPALKWQSCDLAADFLGLPISRSSSGTPTGGEKSKSFSRMSLIERLDPNNVLHYVFLSVAPGIYVLGLESMF